MALSAPMITSQSSDSKAFMIGTQRVAWPRPQSSGDIKKRGFEEILVGIIFSFKTFTILINKNCVIWYDDSRECRICFYKKKTGFIRWESNKFN